MNMRAYFSRNERQTWYLIFLLCLMVRIAFIAGSGYDSFQLQSDTARYDLESTQILRGDYNLKESLAIISPLYPYLQALFKILFKDRWILCLQCAQILLSSLSGVYIYRIARLVFTEHPVALMSAVIYSFYPMTLWLVHTFSQDMLFQCLLIFCLYYLLRGVYQSHLKSLITSAILFSLTFLTKSHILFFAPFIVLMILLFPGPTLKERASHSILFTSICVLLTLPYGLYNLSVNGVYVLSSTGLGGHFMTGHNDDIYRFIVETPPRGSAEYEKLNNMNFECFRRLGNVSLLPDSERQKIYLREGWDWIVKNPRRFFLLSGYDFFKFLMPGVSRSHYPFTQWLFSFLLSAPLYLFGYLGIIQALGQDFRRHLWILGLFLTMLIFSVGFYVQNRFRTITLEPFYVIYASFWVAQYLKNRGLRKSAEEGGGHA